MLANPPSPILERSIKIPGIEPISELEANKPQSFDLIGNINAINACGCPRVPFKSDGTTRARGDSSEELNPVVVSTKSLYESIHFVKVDDAGVRAAADYISRKLREETYTPTTWRTHPLHLLPPIHYNPSDPRTRATLDWIFLISSLNFSFWSDKEGLCPGDAKEGRYAVEWWSSWEEARENRKEKKMWTGYWSLVAAINRALDNGIPITDPAFYSCPEHCPDSTIEAVFEPAPHCTERVPLLKERIRVLREVGTILCQHFEGSFQGFLAEFHKRHGNSPGGGSALQLVKMVTDTFPSFRDETKYEDQTVYFWKRAQILVAETWAAFYPLPATSSSFTTSVVTTRDKNHIQNTIGNGDITNGHSKRNGGSTTVTEEKEKEELRHPFLPNGVSQLTMFADYRVPQILHHLGILSYPSSLVEKLRKGTYLEPGCMEEISIRAASILGVEAVRDVILAETEETFATKGKGSGKEKDEGRGKEVAEDVSSVLIDFYLWDLAKKIERGEEVVTGISTSEVLPAHRTRSIWY